MGLFIKKPLADLMTEANDSGSKSLKRILGPWSLIALGVGCYYRCRIVLHYGCGGRRVYGACHYFIFRYRRLGLLFRRVMLRRVRIHDPGGR